jgi:hypothetical protein
MQSWERLSPLECVNAYGQQFQTKRSNVILVKREGRAIDSTTNTTFEYKFTSIPEISDGDDQFPWICGSMHLERFQLCENYLDQVRANISSWAPYGEKIDYCLSEPMEEVCKLQASLHIAVTVIVFNVIKILIMACLIFGSKANPLLTVGDGLASFLERADMRTAGNCLLSKRNVIQEKDWWSVMSRTHSHLMYARRTAVTFRRRTSLAAL